MPRIASAAALVLFLVMTGTAAAQPELWMKRVWAETDFSKHSLPFSEILAGGPPKDGIPSIDDPEFRPASEVTDIAGSEPVIRLELNGDLRAYPLRVLTWHEIVNDTVGGVPVAVTYCPLCNTALVFRRVVTGEPTTFGTTGMLRHSDLVMYDRKTESWWQQFTGEAIVGERTGDILEMVPVRVVAFGAFRAEAPVGSVLVPNDPNLRPYGRNPYVEYDSRGLPYPFFTGEMPEGIEPMERVVVVHVGNPPTAIRLSHLRDQGEVLLGEVTVRWQPGVSSALDAAEIGQGRDVGTVRVTRRNANGGQQDVLHDTTFAFAFHAFHPKAEIIGK